MSDQLTMSIKSLRKFLILPGALLLGLAAAQALERWLPAAGRAPAGELVAAGAALLAAALGLYLEQRLSQGKAAGGEPHAEKSAGGRLDTQQLASQRLAGQRIQTELLLLNQELETRARLQSSELARLNVELELQIAKHRQAEDLATQSEERFHNMADHIQDGLTILENGRLVYVNQRACEIFGACPDGDLLQRVRRFALPQEQARLEANLAAGQGQPHFELQYWITRPDGSRRCLREHCSNSQLHEIQRSFVVTSDITESIQAYQTLEQAVSDRTRELSAVLEVSKKIATTLELEPLLNLVLDQIQTIIPYSGAAVFTLEDQALQLAACQLPGRLREKQSVALPLTSAGPFLPVIQEKRVLILADVLGQSPLARAVQASRRDDLPAISFAHARSWIGIPLVFRGQVTGLLSLTHSQPGYYTEQHVRLAETITNQVAVAIENARLYEQAQNLATLQERHRIARELHDSATQLLYGITLYCAAAARSLRSRNHRQVELDLVEIKENALQALQEMRLLILELDPPMLQKEGLVAALQASLESIENRTGLVTELEAGGVGRLPKAIEPELYRIAMEALNNLVRYAHARCVSVSLQARSGWLFLEIRDNGVGFDLEQARQSGGMGLHSMEQRASRLGGRLEISSQPGAGTLIRVEVPAQELAAEPLIG